MIRSFKFLTWGSGAGYLLLLVILYVFTYFIVVKDQKHEVTEIYFADRVTDAHRILIEKYNALNAGRIKVIPIDFPNLDFSTNERKEILTRSLRGEGDGIDLFAVDVVWVQRFARWCEPLGQYFSEEELKRIIPDALYSCYTETQLVAVPLDLVQGVMYYREDLLKNFPGGNEIIRALQSSMSWPDFLLLKDRLKWRGPYFVFPAAEYEGLICSYIEILLNLKPDYFSTIGFNFETREAKEALQLMVDLVQKYKASPEVVTKFTEVSSYEYYVKNDGLFIRGWNTYDKDFQNAPYDSVKERHLRKAPLPHISSGRPASVFGGWNLMVSKFSKKKEAVIDFVKFLLRDESQEVFYTKGGFYPVTSAFYGDSSSLRRYPEISGIKERMRTGVHRPPQKDYTNYSTIMAHYFVQAIRNEITVDEAVESVNRAIRSDKTLVVAR